MRVLPIAFLILAPRPADAVEIRNFRSGLACTNTEIREGSGGWICQPTEEILITDQGKCVFNGKEKLCTWIGFEFDYVQDRKASTLQCVTTTSMPVDLGNPGKLIGKDESSQTYELELEGRQGHFFNPQYFAFKMRSGSEGPLVTTGECKAERVTVFSYRFHIRFPAVPDDAR